MNGGQFRTHGLSNSSLYIQHNVVQAKVSFNLWFHKNFRKRLFQERSRLVTFNFSYYFIARDVVAIFVNILKFHLFFILSLNTVALTRYGGVEIGFLCDETDVIRDTIKGTRSAQDIHYKACISLAVCVYVFCTIPAMYINPTHKKINRLNFVTTNQCFL